MASCHIHYRLVGHIYLNLGLWVGKHSLKKFLLELLAYDDWQHEAVEQIVAVNVGKGTADNYTHAIAGNGPCCMLTTGAGTPVLTTNNDFVDTLLGFLAILCLVHHEV